LHLLKLEAGQFLPEVNRSEGTCN